MGAEGPDVGTVIIAGAGQAGFQTAASLRQHGFSGRIVLIGEEIALPYQRPPLSKTYLVGRTDVDGVQLRARSFFDDNDIELRCGEPVVEIDRSEQFVRLASGESIGYDHLVLALGARNRRLPVPGAHLAGVQGLRSVDDADELRIALSSARRLVVVGAGFIGLEFAAAARDLGAEVTLVEALPKVMSRAVSAPTSDYFVGFHRERGVRLLLGVGVTGIVGCRGVATGVDTDTAGRLEADVVLVGVGVRPETELAEKAGLLIEDGIVVDERLRTSDPRISAIGDCARFPGRVGRVRLESVQNAVDQARCVAEALAGQVKSYSAVPWFWSDQGSAKLQIAGLSQGHDRTVVRGSPEEGKFSVFCFRGDDLVAAESVRRAADHMAVRRILGAGARLSVEQAADPDFDLKTYSKQLSE